MWCDDREVIESRFELSKVSLATTGTCSFTGDIETLDIVGRLTLGSIVVISNNVDGTSLGTFDIILDGLFESIVDGIVDGEAIGIGLFRVGE
jgi:hypothetical protein